MRVLMISIDKGLVGGGQLGDVVERHRKYGEELDALDIIVLSKRGFSEQKLSDKVLSYPTNSASKFLYVRDGVKLGKYLFSKNKYDLIVTQDPFATGMVGTKLKKLFGSKLVVNFHGDFFDNPYWIKESLFNRVLLVFSKKVVRAADGIRVMSQMQKAKLLREPQGKKIVKVISTPVDVQRFSDFPNQVENKQQINALVAKKSEKKVVLMVGRKDKAKDFDTLFSAFELIQKSDPNVRFWLVGNYLTEDLPSSIQKNSEGIGKVDAQSLPAFYHAVDVVVLSSSSESFGKVLVEANACAKPVVSTDTSGAREIIRQGYNGYLVPIKDAERLAERVMHILKQPMLAKQFGENGQKLVTEKFANNTDKILGFWKEVALT